MDDQRKKRIDPQKTLKRNHYKQLQIHNILTYDVENTNSTN